MPADHGIPAGADGRRAEGLTPIPSEGDQAFDRIVDALMACFHFPEDHACRVTVVVLEALRDG